MDIDTLHANPLEDVVDEFCYELAMTLRRILGLPMPWDDSEEEEAEDDDDL